MKPKFLSQDNLDRLTDITTPIFLESITVSESTEEGWPHDKLMEKLTKATERYGGHVFTVIVNIVEDGKVYTKASILAMEKTLEDYTALLVVTQPLIHCVAKVKHTKGPRDVGLKEAMYTYMGLTDAFKKRFENEDKWAVAKEFLVALHVRYMGSDDYVEV